MSKREDLEEIQQELQGIKRLFKETVDKMDSVEKVTEKKRKTQLKRNKK